MSFWQMLCTASFWLHFLVNFGLISLSVLIFAFAMFAGQYDKDDGIIMF